MTSTPPLSIDEKPLDLDEEPINLKMQMPNLGSLTRQVTDVTNNTNNNNIKQEINTEDDAKITDKQENNDNNNHDNEFTMDLSLGSLTRQQTDVTHNNDPSNQQSNINDESNTDQDIDTNTQIPLLPNLSGMERQKTSIPPGGDDDTNIKNINDDEDPIDTNTEIPLLPNLSGMQRQKTSIPPEEEDIDIQTTNIHSDDEDGMDTNPEIPLLPNLSGMERQKTSIPPEEEDINTTHINNDNIVDIDTTNIHQDEDEEEMDTNSQIPLLPNLSRMDRQKTSIPPEEDDIHIDIDIDNDNEDTIATLPNLGIQRQRTSIPPNDDDMVATNIDDDDNKDGMDIPMGPLPDLSGLTRQQTDVTHDQDQNIASQDNDNDNNDEDGDNLDMPNLNDIVFSGGLNRQITDVTNENKSSSDTPPKDNDDGDDLDMPQMNNLMLSGLIRQQTDIQNQGDNDDYENNDIHNDENKEDVMTESGPAIPDFSSLIRQQTDVTMNNNENEDNEDKIMEDNGDDIGGDAFGALPNLNDIARQKTDASDVVDDEEEEKKQQKMIDQMDMSLNETKSKQEELLNKKCANKSEEVIKYLPPRVPSTKSLQTEVAVDNNDGNNNNNDNNNNTSEQQEETNNDPLNQYLDPDLVMFDDKGQLFDNDEEQFIPTTLINNEEENDTDDANESPQEIEDDSLNQFIEHDEPIICLAFNPKKNYEIVSGGQDENCYIWDIVNYDSTATRLDEINDNAANNNEEKKDDKEKPSPHDTDTNKLQSGFFKINNHSDTIMDASWNSSGKYIATASMDSSIKIFNSNKNMKLVSSLEAGGEVSFIEWHPNNENDKKYKNILMAGSFDKNLWIYQYNKQTKQFIETQILSGHSSEIECGGFTKYNNGKYGYSGDKDGMIIIWESIIDCDAFSGKKRYSFKPLISNDDEIYNQRNTQNIGLYHESGITCIDDCRTAPLLISGSSDHSVCLINYENGKILQKLGKHEDSVECVQFNKLYKQEIKYTNYASSSSLDGIIKIWDLNTGKIRNELKHDDGVIVHEWFNTEKNSNLIASGCMNGIIHIWDSRSAKSIKQLKGHGKCAIQSIKITNDDKYICSAGDDSIAMVWKS